MIASCVAVWIANCVAVHLNILSKTVMVCAAQKFVNPV
jgi:hypothetical protein